MHFEAIRHVNSLHGSILFSGFHYLPEHMGDGWVYWLPKYILENTSLKVYFLTNDRKLLFQEREGALHEIAEQSIEEIDIFFARTLNSFPVENRLLRSAKLKILYPVSNTIPEKVLQHDPAIIEDSMFIKPLPEYDRKFFYYQPSKKENFFLYPSALHRRKGQYEFAKLVSKKTMAGKKVIFCGTIKSGEYAEKCFDVLRKKNIDFEYLNKVSKEELGELYRKSRLTLILSKSDWNPRTFYESIACGTPCLLSRQVKLALQAEQYAFRTYRLLLNHTIRKNVNYPESLPLQLYETSLTIKEESCYNRLFSEALTQLKKTPTKNKKR